LLSPIARPSCGANRAHRRIAVQATAVRVHRARGHRSAAALRRRRRSAGAQCLSGGRRDRGVRPGRHQVSWRAGHRDRISSREGGDGGMITDEVGTFSDTVEEAAPVEACTQCSACNTVCPVARSTEILRGPKFLGPESVRFRSQPEAAVTAGLDLCSGCKLCEVTCPSQVTIQEYIRRAQNKGAEEKGRTLRDWVLGHTRLLSRFGSMTAPLANFGNRNPLVRWVMERVLGIHHKRPLPRYQWLTFERWFKRPRQNSLPLRGTGGVGAGQRTVAYF